MKPFAAMEEIGSRIFQYIAFALEAISAAVIVAAIIIAGIKALAGWKRAQHKHHLYRATKHTVGRGILLGLELLIAADIVRTVCLEFNWKNIGLLGLIVIIRIILGFTLEVEMTGKWPWQQKR